MAWVTKNSQETYADNEPARTYTKAEKAGNWWHYNKWIVAAVVVAVIVVAAIVKDTVFRAVPDYQIGYVGLQELPADTAAVLTASLQPFCEDLNGDGQVLIQLNQYALDLDEESNDDADPYVRMAGITKLSADLASTDGSYIYILEDPESFQAYTGGLRYLDGTVPGQDPVAMDWQNMVYRWTDCPVLTGLDLGEYTGYTLVDDTTGSSQEVMGRLYVARRGVWTDDGQEDFASDEALWQALTAGAVSTAAQD